MTIAHRVFLLGAGASRSCGLPLTRELFPLVAKSLDNQVLRQRLTDFLIYLYPTFRPKWENYPNLEEFLSLAEVYLDWAPAVKSSHRFEPSEIGELKQGVLRALSKVLVDRLRSTAISTTALFNLVKALRKGDVIITFN